jgi:hypothetical protein
MQIVGLVLLALGGQGAVRLLLDDRNAGLVRPVPGGFAAWLACYAVAVLAGVALAARGSRRAEGGDGGT